MTRTITDDEFIKAFDAAVEDRGREFVYPDEWKTDGVGDVPSCLYNLEDGTPGCVFGLAFHKLGLAPADGVITDIMDMTSAMTREVFENELDSEGPEEGTAIVWREKAGVTFSLSRDVRYAAQQAQAAQDMGETWGYASDAFYRFLDGEAPGAD